MHTLDWFDRISSCHSFLSATKHAINKSLIRQALFRCIINHFWGIRKRNIEIHGLRSFKAHRHTAIQSKLFQKKYFLWDEGLLARHRQIISQARHRHVMNYFRRIHLRKGSRKEIGDVFARRLRIQKSKKVYLYVCILFPIIKFIFLSPRFFHFQGRSPCLSTG